MNRTVMVIDDEAAMRTLHRRILVDAGYSVTLAGSVAEAIALLKGAAWPDLVIVDLNLPGVSGDEFVRRIRRVRPEQKVLYVTANVRRLLNSMSISGRTETVLDKPFTSKGLLAAVAALLPIALPESAGTSRSCVSLTRVLVVDDLAGNRQLIRRLLPADEFAVDATDDPDRAIATALNGAPDVILLDARMPRRDGFDLCRHLKGTEATRLIPIVLVTAARESEDRLRAIEAGADDFIAKPINPVELQARVRALARGKRYTDELDNAEEVIVSLALTIEARDRYTDGHCQRLARYATAMGEALSLPPEDIRALQRGGYLHDVGKIAIPDAILAKPGALTGTELEIMRSHPIVGERLCGRLRSLARVRPIVRHHHERRDGSGYPDGLKGDEIPLLAEIVGLVDVFDALTTDRPYRNALSIDDAVAALCEEVARGWRRRELVDLLVSLDFTAGMDSRSLVMASAS
jgi:putative two-component system response regulator